MSKEVKLLFYGLIFAAFFLGCSSIFAHDTADPTVEPSFKIGKNGEVNVKMDVQIGTTVLKKGKYTVEHRIEGNSHIFTFIDAQNVPIVIKSKAVFPGEKTSESMIHAREEKANVVRVTVIEIAGENVDHTF